MLHKSKQKKKDGSLSFEAIRGKQAGRTFYNSMCSFGMICDYFKPNENSDILPAHTAQRKLRKSRIPKIGNYILDNPDTYIFPPIMVSIGGSVRFNPTPGQGKDDVTGKVIISENAPILINDGQHRCAAIRYVCEKTPSLRKEKIPVVIFEDKGLKYSQQMFRDLNFYWVKPSKSLGILYNHRNLFAKFIVSLVDDVTIFSGRTEMGKTRLSKNSENFFTLNGITDATKYLLKLKTKSIASEKQQLAANYWDVVSKNIIGWNLLIQKKINPVDLREMYVHAHTNTLNALGIAGHVLITEFPDNAWQEKLRGLRTIDWEKSSPLWKGTIVNDGKMIKNKIAIRQAADKIIQHCGSNTTLKEFESSN